MENTSQLDKIAFAANRDVSEEKYWLNKLSGELVESTFPHDRKKRAAKKYQLEEIQSRLTGDIFARLMQLSNDSFARLHMILIAALCLLLGKYSGNKDILVGTPIYKQDIDREFINTVLILRNQLKENMTFKDLVLQVRETLTEADDNQNYPIEMLLQKLKIPFSKGDDFPLIPVAVVLENIQDKKYLRYIKPDILFSFSQTRDSIDSILRYNASLYHRATVERIAGHLGNLFRETLFKLDLPLSHIHILTEEEKKQLLYDCNQTKTSYPADKCIHQLFREQAQKTPANIALEYKGEQLTYQELNEESNRLARFLRTCGLKPGSVAAIMLEHSMEIVTAILGVLKSGAAYLPLDPDTPVKRVNAMLTSSSAAILLNGSGEPTLEEIPAFAFTAEEKAALLTQSGEEPVFLNHPTDLAYIIFTSGSTGNPKGVMTPHRSLVNYICWAAGYYLKGRPLAFPLYTAISFDLTVTSLFTPLVTGNTILIYSGDHKEFLIEKIIDDNKAGIVKLTPTHLKLIRDKKINNSTIMCFIVGGEELETRLVLDIHRNFGAHVEIINEYGPTEATVGCMIYTYHPYKDKDTTVPIGLPIHNTRIYILDENLTPVPFGVAGEIVVAGDGTAAGYIRQEELSAEKFPTDPFVQGTRMYRTGDLGKRMRDGNIQFLGRIDKQVKIRGFRIELEEIERQLQEHPHIKEAVVTAGKNSSGDNELTAYTVAEIELNLTEVKEYLSRRIPYYMVPAYIVPMDKIPITSNGKVDTRGLPDVNSLELREMVGSKYAPPTTEFQEKLAELWRQILEVERVGINDNFFDLGGDSLKVIRLVRQLNEADVDITVDKVFLYPTIIKISSFMNDKTSIETDNTVDALKNYLSENYGDNVSFQKYSMNGSTCYVLFILDNELIAADLVTEIIHTFGHCYYPNYVKYVNTRDDIMEPGKIDDNLLANMLQLKTTVTKLQHAEMTEELDKNDNLSILLKENTYSDEYPVSPLQRFHFTTKRMSTNITFFSYEFSYPTTVEKIKTVVTQLVNENSLLRSVIVKQDDDYYIKEFDSFSNIEIPFIDVSGFSLAAREEISDTFRENLYKPFDLTENLLYRILLFKWDERKYKLFIILNHLIFDGESHKILRERIDRLIEQGAHHSGNNRPGKSFRDYTEFLSGISENVAGLEQYLDLPDYMNACAKARARFETGNLKIHGFDLDISILKGNLKDMYNEIILLCYARMTSNLFEMENAPIIVISSGRNYKDGNFNNIIGDFHDLVPVQIPFESHSTPQQSLEGLKNYMNYRTFIVEKNLNFINFFVKKYKSGVDYSNVFTSPFRFNSSIGEYDFFKKSFYDKALRKLVDPEQQTSHPSFQMVISKDHYSDNLWVSYTHNSKFGNENITRKFRKYFKELTKHLNSI
jgi:amino acid adenylation domain-containing protein